MPCVLPAVQIAHHVRDIRTSSVACGVGNVVGNKGGVAVSCSVAGARWGTGGAA
jgi:hypothetical protein